MKTLSIFVDESGDFGRYNSKFAPQYVFSMVFHEQEFDISDAIRKFEQEMKHLGYPEHVVHTAPLIRREENYRHLSANERRAILTKIYYFAKSLPIRYKTFLFERKECIDAETLRIKIHNTLSRFIDAHISYFLSFDEVILYYDNGQKQLAKELQTAFATKLPVLYRKPNVASYKYKLLQVADMLCTLCLLEQKSARNNLTSSELHIFHSSRDLKKDFLKNIKRLVFV